MAELDVTVRAPTGTAWIAAAVATIVAGEALWEMRKETPSVIFNTPFSDSELLVVSILGGLVALVAITWLVSLYVAPGRLLVDGGVLRREERLYVRRAVAEAPLDKWKARIFYFSERQRDTKVFKRIELVGPGRDEVLLFGDFRRGEEVARALEEVGDQLGELVVDVQKPSAPSTPAEPSPQ